MKNKKMLPGCSEFKNSSFIHKGKRAAPKLQSAVASG